MNSKSWTEFERNIEKTGFVLEYNISALLRKHGWTVISNKYYMDDVQPAIREIDIVSYKVRIFKEFSCYTALIISCKKSAENLWVLLCKEKYEKDPNINWHPIHVWTNDKVLSHILNEDGFTENYLNKFKDRTIFDKIIDPSSHIFAFQEMNKKKASIQNDKQIFSSITSLMKAQGYEMNSLGKRKKRASIYQFNLMSVIDTDLIEMFPQDNGMKTHQIEEAKYIGNYIIKNQETCARIHFITYPAFEKFLGFYDTLHECNLEFFKGEYESFFQNALSDLDKKQVFIEEFNKDILWSINSSLRLNRRNILKIEDLYLAWDREKQAVSIDIEASVEDLEILNSDQKLKREVGKALKKYYRYRGDITFSEWDLPF
jgi:hypothetical protein